jgi:glycosyltransferase involved in cell wall biosynthesis
MPSSDLVALTDNRCYELVVVDDGSTDDTATVVTARDALAQVPSLADRGWGRHWTAAR